MGMAYAAAVRPLRTLQGLGLLALCCVLVDGSTLLHSAWGNNKAQVHTAQLLLSSHNPAPLRLRGGSIVSELSIFACFGAGMSVHKGPSMTTEVADAPEIPGESKPRRDSRFPQLIGHANDDKPEIDTPLLAFYAAVERFPNAKCLGKRFPNPDGKGAGPYEWLTYSDVKKNVLLVGEHLAKTCGLARGSKVGIYSMNRPEWTTSALAMWSQGLVCVPLYDSVGVDAVRFIVNHAALPVVFCERSKLPTLLDASKESRYLYTHKHTHTHTHTRF